MYNKIAPDQPAPVDNQGVQNYYSSLKLSGMLVNYTYNQYTSLLIIDLNDAKK